MAFRASRKRQRSESVPHSASSRVVQNSPSTTRASALRSSQPPSTPTPQGLAPRVVQWRSPQVQTSNGPPEAQSALLDRLVDATDADIDALDEIIMAVDIRERKSVGCSYYVAREEKLYLMEDMKLGDVEVIDTRKPLSFSELLNSLTFFRS